MEQSFVQKNIKVLLKEDNLNLLSFLKCDNFLKLKLKELLAFYEKETCGICLIDGKGGSYKTEVFKYSADFLSENVLTFKFKCFEGSTLDDIFLAFFEDLKKYSQQKKIAIAKIETNSLSQRINNYLNHLNLPSIIFIDSLENIFNKKNNAEKEEFLDFIRHLNSMNKFKIILAGNNLNSYFENSQIKFENYQTITMEPYRSEGIEEYFKSLNIDTKLEDILKFYTITRGNAAYLYITGNIIITLKVTLEKLLSEFANKKVSYEDFILQKLCTFVPENAKKSLYYLSMINEGLSRDYLLQSEFFTKEQINYMTEKAILANEYGYIYLKGYLKKYLQSYIPHFEKLKIHTFWRDFYNSQLPIKPSSRVILISRNTMRSQIEYHSSFLDSQNAVDTMKHDLSLMSYTNSHLTSWNFKNTNEEDKPETSPNTNKKGLKKYELTKQELSLFNAPVDMRKTKEEKAREKVHRTLEQKEEEILQKKQKLTDVLNLAKELEEVHSFESAFAVYQNAFELKEDPEYQKSLPVILYKLAHCSKKLNKSTEAIVYYNSLVELYSSVGETEKMNETRLEIAQIYKETYKLNHARAIYENFISKKSNASENIVACSYIQLAEIEDDLANLEKAIEYYKKAFLLFENVQEKQVYTQAYFKYALILDDNNQTEAALDYYQKCIRNSSISSVYVSCAYTNIAEILKEKGNLTKAIEYYKLGLKTDIDQSNHEGIYYITLKIAKTNETLNPKTVLNWLLKSLSAAKRTKENMYIINAYKELGDYYREKNEPQKAEKAFSLAKKKELENG